MAARSVSHRFFQVTLWTLKSWMVVYLYMVWIDCYNAAVTGQHQVIGSSQPVLAREGDDVILPCHIEPPVDMEEQTVEWTRPDLTPTYVHVHQDGRYKFQYTNPSYKQRTTLFHEKLSRGNISLKLYGVRLSDEGTYKCSAITPDPSSSSIELRVAPQQPALPDVSSIPPQGVLRLLPDTSSVTKPITSILWKHGPNKAAEWDLVLGPVVDYYGTCKNRAEMDKETGQLVINNMTIEDSGEYSVHINGRLLSKTYTVKLMKKVPKPVVTKLPCDSDSTSCEVVCVFLEDVTESGSVTYRWKKDEGEWMESDSGPNSNRLIVTKDEDGKVKTLTCGVKNEFSMEGSHPQLNLLYEGPPPKPTPTGGIVAGVLVVVILAVGVVLGVKYPDRIRKMFPCLQPAPGCEDEMEVLTPSRSPNPWTSKSLRWRPRLEKLASNKHDCEVIKVGSFVFVDDSEFFIGSGNNGTEVFLGLRNDGTEVAVKKMTTRNYKKLWNKNTFSRLLKLDDPSIVRYVDCAEDKKGGYLALELCEYNLEEYITDNKNNFSELEKKQLANQVLISLKVLHCQDPPILHRDIKPQNVLIDTVAKARLADFGMFLKPQEITTTMQGKQKQCWMSREMLKEEECADSQVAETEDDAEDDAYTTSSDIQVAGMLIYYILSGGHHPFGSGIKCPVNIHEGKYNLDNVQDEAAKHLIDWMIIEDPDRRPTVEQCLAHSFWSNEKIGNQHADQDLGALEQHAE